MDAPEKVTRILNVTTLGSFSVSVENHVISDTSARAQRMWRLFKYFITYCRRPIPTDTLIQILWDDDAECDNPTKALYSLVHRLRTVLSEVIPQNSDFLVFQHGSYLCNPDGFCDVDAYRFEALVNEGSARDLPEENALSLLSQAIDLYGGDYLGESAYEEWVIPVSTYYTRLFSETVETLCRKYLSEGRYEETVKLCEKCIGINNLEETYHIYLLRALIGLGRIAFATSHYEHITKLLYKELGIEPSAELQAISKELHSAGQGITGTLSEIKLVLREAGDINGAFYCDFSFFRQIYQLEMRTLTRSGQAVFLGLITLTCTDYRNNVSSTFGAAMQDLKNAGISCLRKGDVLTKYSASQFLYLLPAMHYEDGELIFGRIRKDFFRRCKNPGFRLDFDFCPIDVIL